MTEWWRGAVIYQIYPRSFQDSDGNGVGDLPGIVERLEHVASLGVDAIWLSPIFTSPMEDMGYDVSDYTDIDPLFGGLEDFDSLVRRAHELGVKVIIDQVLSHTSDRHPWFRESRLSRRNAKADWYVWADPKRDGTPPNNWPSVFGGRAWEWNPTRGQYYLHNFLASQPDLNFHNPEVQDAVLAVMRFWLERGVDGFRFDTANFYFHDAELRNNPPARRPKHLPYAVNPYDMQEHRYSKNRPENIGFLKRMRALMDEFPDIMGVGEIGESIIGVQLMAEYTSGGDKLHMAYSFDMLGNEFDAGHFRSRVERVFAASPDAWPCWSFSNHDVIRHATRWAPHARSTAALAREAIGLLIGLRGTLCIYQGEELGLPETDILFEELTDPPGIRFWPEYKGRDGCRTPIPWEAGPPPNGFTTGKPWLPIKPPQSALNVAVQNGDEGSTLNVYRRALAIRRGHEALRTGTIEFLEAAEPLLAFRRTGKSESILCLYNLGPDPLTLALAGGPADEPLIAQAAERHGAQLTLGANGFALLAQPGGEAEITVRYAGERRRKAKAS